jgi:ABC-type antimicrobial peptide transport system permease subunit
MLYDVSSTIVVVYAGAALVVALIATLSTFIPARGATRLDPAIALRLE